MLAFSKRADYALSMLCILAGRGFGGRVTLSELSQMGYPRAFMAKIAKSLVEGGVMSVKEGNGGGYSLNYPPKEITIRDALEAVEGEVEPVSCGKCGAAEECGQRDFMGRLKVDMEKVLEKYSVYDLVDEE